ncbi:hypothetical protein H2201_001714 [Coniosporium apollinis]|uniref:ATP synthase protein 8 n=1 Tax=Coniosporium apollinis TaxID=61459 RepID=A0ABQ9P417_9PEZI|nr:hypothetical protein H2201_001714 [Coniosporium apollinis]
MSASRALRFLPRAQPLVLRTTNVARPQFIKSFGTQAAKSSVAAHAQLQLKQNGKPAMASSFFMANPPIKAEKPTTMIPLQAAMPQLIPFFFVNETIIAFVLLPTLVYLFSKYILPQRVRLMAARMFISKL